jgi:hypothetical protein
MTASHKARAAPRSDALRNRTTVWNRGTRASAHRNSRASAGGGASASTGISDARSAGSSEAPKKAGRDEGGTVCARQAFLCKRRRGGRTFRRDQRDAVSVAGMPSHERVNSKSVRGGTRAGLGVGCDGRADAEPRVADKGTGGCAGSFGAGTSRVLKTVSFPDTRNMPPPTRPAFFSSRTCFASLNDAGSGFGVGPGSAAAAGLGSGDVESRRELMGFKRSFVGSAFVGASESTMVMGTRRRFGGAVVEDVDDASGGAGTSTGMVRCIC